jgi:hypothetical protein
MNYNKWQVQEAVKYQTTLSGNNPNVLLKAAVAPLGLDSVKGVANRVDYRFKSYVVKEKQQYNSSWQKKKNI